MSRITIVRRAVVALLVLSAAVASIATGARAQTFLADDENRMYGMINATRSGVGLHLLKRDGSLDGLARAQAARMAEAEDLFHNPNLVVEIKALGIRLSYGENVGIGISVDDVYASLLKSPGHYGNITKSSVDSVGLGIAPSKGGGMVWVAQVFGQRGGSPAPAPAAPAPAPTQAPAPPPPPPTPAPTPVPTPTPVPPGPDPNGVIHGMLGGTTISLAP